MRTLVSGAIWAAAAGIGLSNLALTLWLETNTGKHGTECWLAGALFGVSAYMTMVQALRAARGAP